eukprot:evm.model.scf_85EXC.14 EVM.evm.TU.scf_85EXC.14   scf_85EXC:112149-112919(-)
MRGDAAAKMPSRSLAAAVPVVDGSGVRALPPLDATVVREKLTSRRRCLGFVTLPDKWAMEDVIRELHKSKVDGRMISVRHGMPKDWQHQQPMRDRVGDSGQGWARTGGCVVRREHPRREPYAVGRATRYMHWVRGGDVGHVEARNGMQTTARSAAVPRTEGGHCRRDARAQDGVPRRENGDCVHNARPAGEESE